MNQILLGACLPFAACVALYARRRGRASLRMLVVGPAFMAAGALWAVVPDLPRLVGHHDLYLRWASDPRMNLFFWHHAIDAVEGYTALGHAGVCLMLASLLAVAWRELKRREMETGPAVRRSV